MAPTNGFHDVPARSAAVIGAGLAGAAVCAELCSRGWQVELVDAAPAAASGASGNHAGVFHPLISRDNNRLARLTQLGVKRALAVWRQREMAGHAMSWSCEGLLQLARQTGRTAGQDAGEVLRAAGVDPDDARAVDAAAASRLAGVPVTDGGVWFAEGGWVQPASLVKTQLASCSSHLVQHFGRSVAAARREGQGRNQTWVLMDAEGQAISRTHCVVLATGADTRLAQVFGQVSWPLTGMSGQLTYLAASILPEPRIPLTRDAYVLPAIDGWVVTGATYQAAQAGACSVDGALDVAFQLEPTAAGHRANLAKLGQIFATKLPEVDADRLAGRVSTRAVTPDRLPLIGQLLDEGALDATRVALHGHHLADLPRLSGVFVVGGFGSRGITWAELAAQLLAAMMEGQTLPLPGDLVAAVDPARFRLRALRRGQIRVSAGQMNRRAD